MSAPFRILCAWVLLGGVAFGQSIAPPGCPSASCPSAQLAISSGSTQTLNPGSVIVDTMTASTAFTLASGLPVGQLQTILLALIQGGSAGYTPTFSNCNWPGNITPTFNTISGEVDWVQALSVNGGSAWSCSFVAGSVPQPAVPSIPTNLAATPLTSYQIQLTANAVTANPAVTGSNIYRGTTSGGESLIASNQSLPYTDTGLAQNTKYYYEITAVNSVGEGAKSAEASATTTAAPYGAHLAMTGTTAGLGYVITANIPQLLPGSQTFSLRARVSPTSPTGSYQGLLGPWQQGAPSASGYELFLTSTGHIGVAIAVGSGSGESDSSATVSFSAGVPTWLRGDCNPGTSCTFYTSTDNSDTPSNWTQLGTANVAFSGATGTVNSTSLGIQGGNTWSNSGTLPLTGDWYAAQVWINGVEITAPAVNTSTPSGCVVLDSFSLAWVISASHASCP